MWLFKKKSNDIDFTPLDKLNETDDEDTRERLLIKSAKTINEKVNTLQEEKSDKIFYIYKLPAVNLCSYSLF